MPTPSTPGEALAEREAVRDSWQGAIGCAGPALEDGSAECSRGRCDVGSLHARKCKRSDEPVRWKVSGPDLDDDELTVVIVFEAGVLVVTAF